MGFSELLVDACLASTETAASIALTQCSKAAGLIRPRVECRCRPAASSFLIKPTEGLTLPSTHPRMRVAELALRLRMQAFVAGMI